MSATVKHIPTKSSPNLDDYLGRQKKGNDLPRVLYEAGQHCRPETAKAEFQALRREHGREGEMRTVPGKYVEPDDPADATHLKVGKNWRKAKPGERATHRRIAPAVPLEKRDEAHHFIYSFDLATVNPDDPEQCRRAFEAVVAFREQDTPGTQSKFVAHGDAKGSKAAIERGEGGKFHVHEAMNAVVHSDMVVEGRVFEAGQRVGGPITHTDSYRARWDRFLETRGHEFGLGPQDRSVLPAVDSPEYRGRPRRSNQDFWEQERGGISDHDRARRGMETAFEALAADPQAMSGLTPDERLHRLAAEAQATGDVELKLRSTQKGDRIRSFVVPGRAQAIGSTKLGGRYSNAGVAEQLELIAQGQWKPVERGTVGPPTEIPELPDSTVQSLQERVDQMALDEQREAELDAWLADRAAESGTSVDELWAARGMTGGAADREVARGWKSDWEAEQAARAEREAARAAVADAEAPAQAAETPRRRFEMKGAAEADVDGPAVADAADVKPVPRAPRHERPIGLLRADQMQDVEMLAVVRRERDGGAYVDFQVAASDPLAKGRSGLHLIAKRETRERDRRKVEITRTWQQLTASQYAELRAAAGDNSVRIDGREVLAVRGNIMPALKGGYTANTKSLGPSQRPPIGPDALEKQRESEDRARRGPDVGRGGPGGPSSPSEMFSQRASAAASRSEGRDR